MALGTASLTSTPNVQLDRRVMDAFMVDVMEEAKKRVEALSSPYLKFQAKYRDDPERFTRDCFIFTEGDWPTDYQLSIMDDLIEHKRVAVRGPRGGGKTALAAWLILWFALTRDGKDWKVITTASVWRQVEKFLWPEIHKWSRHLRWDRIGRQPFNYSELLKLSLELSTGQAFGVASTDPNYVEGGHAKHLLVVFDEGKVVPDPIWDALEGAFASPDTDEAFALAISTPGEPIGRFYDIHSKRIGLEVWHTRHVTVDQTVRARRVSQEWVDNKKALWGESSSLYQNQVLGNFAVAEEEGVIPLSWIESANYRYDELIAARTTPTGEVGIGIDIARTSDDSVIVVRHDNIVTDIHRLPTADTMTTVGNIINYLRTHQYTAVEPVVDVIGLGAGVVDRLREQGIPVIAFHASESTTYRDKSGELEFLNKRAAGWWKLRESLDPSNNSALALPRDDILTRELTAVKWKPTSAGKIKIESKDDIRKRINRSTDTADALIMALYGSSIESNFSGGTVGYITLPLHQHTRRTGVL
jgi:hypothetical protein